MNEYQINHAFNRSAVRELSSEKIHLEQDLP